jgi:ABC-type oligopeptide transport system ATPase subunit
VCDERYPRWTCPIQATIINLLMDLQKKRRLSYLFISHDLSVVRHISNRIAVMYLGQIIVDRQYRRYFSKRSSSLYDCAAVGHPQN